MDVLQKLVPWVALAGVAIGLLVISYGGFRRYLDDIRRKKR